MKKNARRLTALAVALALTVGMMGQTAFASWALGTELLDRTVELANGVSWTCQSLWSASKSDLRTENYLTYIPGGAAKPMVYSGTYVASINTVAAAADELRDQGYRVVAAVNGGFFNTDGTIVGMLMTDGVIRSLDVENYTLLGFTNDGEVFIDESTVIKTVSWKQGDSEKEEDGQEGEEQEEEEGEQEEDEQEAGLDFTCSLAGYNAYRNAKYINGAFLYNGDFASMVYSDTNNVSAILQPVDGGVMKMNSELTLEVVSVADTAREDVDFNGMIPEGCYMLYAEYHTGNGWLTDGIRALVPGQTVTVSVSGVSEQWEEAAYGISGLYTLLREGKIVPGLSDKANPYTAVGVREDGTAVFYTIDGRQSGYSVGATYAQVAERLQELGCVTAVALDGGGSTNFGATLPGSSDFIIQNRPSTNGRRVNNSILLVAPDEGPTGIYAGAYVDAPNTVVFVGTELPVTAVLYDTAGYPVTDRAPVWTSDSGLIRETDSGAVFSSNITGIFRVSADPDGEGVLPVRVVDTLSSLRVCREDTSAAVSLLVLNPGDTVDLTATGTWWNLPAAVDDSSVVWSADDLIGTIDDSGCFRAMDGHTGASGNITAEAGGRTVTVQVTVLADCPFIDIAGHWSEEDVVRMYKLGITSGYSQPDGTVVFRPNDKLTRGELFAYITRMLGVDTDEYQDVTLPFEDTDSIDDFLLPYVKAMYALDVVNGSASGGKLYANVDSSVSREEVMTILGRILAYQGESRDLSDFADSDLVSDWARPYIEILVGLNVVQGSDGLLSPKSDITRGEGARLLVEVSGLEKVELTQRPSGPESGAPEEQEPEGQTPGDPEEQEPGSQTPGDPEEQEPENQTPGDSEGQEPEPQIPGAPEDTFIGPGQRPEQSEGE